MKCTHCPAERPGDRLPSGWKRRDEAITCDRCWKSRYVLRAVTTPVAGPDDGDWPTLRAALKSCWQRATALANWAVVELAKADVIRSPDMARLPKMPPVYLYGLAGEKFDQWGLWDGTKKSASSILRQVEAKYRARRLDVVWLRKAALPTFRYPLPYPIHNQEWSIEADPGGAVFVSARLGADRFRLRLRGGPEFRRQMAAVRQLIAGEAEAGEMVLYEAPAHASDHRPGPENRAPGGGGRKATRLMAKLVMWLPRREAGPREGTLYLRTAADSFWVYHVGRDGEVKYLHADHVRRWIAEHRRRLQRMSDDLKYENRWPKPVRRRMVESQEARVLKTRNRLESWCHQASAMIAGFAARQRVATVQYDETAKGFADKFPWHMLRTMLQYKLDERGIALDVIGERDGDGNDNND